MLQSWIFPRNFGNSVQVKCFITPAKSILIIQVDFVVEEKSGSELFRNTASVNVTVYGRDRLWFRLASNSTEKIFGGGEQFTYLNLKGHEFPMWIREQGTQALCWSILIFPLSCFSFTCRCVYKGVGRNLSSSLTQIVERGSPGAGGDYHTTYYPVPMFLSTWNYVVTGKQERFVISEALRFDDLLAVIFIVKVLHLEFHFVYEERNLCSWRTTDFKYWHSC